MFNQEIMTAGILSNHLKLCNVYFLSMQKIIGGVVKFVLLVFAHIVKFAH